jgi:hypothetical protein
MKSLLFFAVAIGIVLFLVWSRPKEGFQDATPPGASPGITIPLISPRDQTLLKGSVVPYAPPTADLLGPPPGQSASVNSVPFEDPALEKAPAGRIDSTYQSLVAFFTNEAPGLSKLGDPSVQLPMSTARSDKARLEDELTVLKRNPGLQSSLTQADMDGIEGNLAYLQKKWRLSVNSGAVEGFQDAGTGEQGGVLGTVGSFFGSLLPTGPLVTPPPTPSIPTVTPAPAPYESTTGPQVNPTGPEGFQSGSDSSITKKDLEDLSTKINLEIMRLEASGTTDLNTAARIEKLRAIGQVVNDTIADVNKGVRNISDVKLTKEEIASFLPVMTNTTTPLPKLLDDNKQSGLLNNLFPTYGAGDVDGAKAARELFDKYADNIFKNLSWQVTLSYKGEAEQAITRNLASAMADAKFVEENAILQGQNLPYAAAGTQKGATATTEKGQAGAGYRGFFDSVVQSATGKKPSAVSVGSGAAAGGRTAPLMTATGTGTGFNWRDRANQICEQVRKRGLDEKEFGCLANPDAMPEDFSWRGYARMVCNRLGTVYPPGTDETCGCPPPTWPGWRP